MTNMEPQGQELQVQYQETWTLDTGPITRENIARSLSAGNEVERLTGGILGTIGGIGEETHFTIIGVQKEISDETIQAVEELLGLKIICKTPSMVRYVPAPSYTEPQVA